MIEMVQKLWRIRSCSSYKFVDKVIDVPVAGGRLQGLSSEDGFQQRFVEQIMKLVGVFKVYF